MNDLAKAKRIIWIDNAKVFGMYLVVLGHTMLTPPHQVLQNVIYAFHMPLFFFISGFLHKSNISNQRFFSSCIKQLLIPFLFFNFLELVPKLFLIKEDFYVVMWNFLKEMGRGIFLGDPPVGPSWFILCLLWMKILLWGCMKGCKSSKSLLCVISFIILAGCFLSYTGYIKFIRFFCIGNALLSFPFYAVAYIVKLNYEQINVSLGKRKWIFPLATILFFIVQHYNGFVSLQSCNTGNSFMLMLIAGFSGILVSIKACTLFKSENRIIYTLSAGSIVILCTHGFILNATVNKYLIGGELYSMPWYIYSIIGCMFIMLIEYPIIRFFFRYLNWSIGGRKL